MTVTTAAIPRYMPMQSTHVPQLASVLPSLVSGTWSEDALLAMQQANHQLRVLESGSQVIGFAEFVLVVDECQIFNIAITLGWQQQGLGKLLLRCLLAEAVHKGMREAVLEVRESNVAARKLYEQSGFVRTGLRPRYYPPLPGDSTHEAAILYSGPLSL